MPENTGDSALFREQMRKTLLNARAALPAVEREQHSQRIREQLRTWVAGPQAQVLPTQSVGFCLPWREECDLRPVLAELAASGWAVSVPVVTKRAQPMRFREWLPASAMTKDGHGIPIPDTDECAPPALLLMPVVGVDRHGYRLGYGGGYFDRTVAALDQAGARPYCLGVGFALACIDDSRPQTHDQRLDLLLTERGMIDFARPTLDARP